ncbi:hypothetical protein [Segetibacter koreensis]|uniref:hypothetical protein n=1 Tax=Segetibacter koreensis TaxID=398037 RepID=UPI00037EFBA2|nr:hypothetical protein [Segetibacter koreensis]
MNIKIKQYIDQISGEIQHETFADYYIENIHELSAFDKINFHLLNKHILQNGESDFFIGIPEEDFREHFFDSVFYAVSLMKLFQNFCTYQKKEPQLATGDIIYTNGRIYQYLGNTYGMMNLKLKFPGKNERDAYIQKKPGIYTKLDQEFDFQKRVTIECLEGYCKFLTTSFKDPSFPVLTEFPHKTLIISDKELTRINQYIPFRYHSKNAVVIHKIPVDTLIDICTSFTVAKILISEGAISNAFDEIIIIGDAKYRDEIFADIQNSKAWGHFKSIILIGTNKPKTFHRFREWNWTKREIIIAQKQVPNELSPVTIKDDNLLVAINEFHRYIETVNRIYNTDISYLLKFVNFFLRQVLPGSEADFVYASYLSRVQNHLEDKEFDGLLLAAVNYNQSAKKEIISNIINHFIQLKELITVNNAKLEWILSLAKERKINLLIDKRQGEILKQYFKRKEIRNIKLITNKKVGSVTLLDDFITDQSLNNPEKPFVVSYLSDPNLYNQLMEVKGMVKVLCYNKLDIQLFENLKAKEENELAKHISHKDRNYFIGNKFDIEEKPLIQTQFYKHLFEFKEPSILSRRFNTDGEPSNEGIWYEVEFTDGTTDLLTAAKSVIWIFDGEQTEITIEECAPGSYIKYYKNSSKKDFDELLKLRDGNGVLDNIEKLSALWKRALISLLAGKNHKKLYDLIFRTSDVVSFNTFKSYFDPTKSTLFPQNGVLEAMLKYCNQAGWRNMLFVERFEEIRAAATQNKSIKIKFGHHLSRLFESDGPVDIDGVIADANELPDHLKAKVLSFIKSGTIKSKKIINSNDGRISNQSQSDFQRFNS